MVNSRRIIYLHIKTTFEGAEEDGDSVAETNLPSILTYMDEFSWVRYIPQNPQKFIHLKNFYAYIQ